MSGILDSKLLRPTVVASIALIVLGATFAAGGVILGVWVDGGPGPGLLPLVAAVLMLALVGLVLLSLSRSETEEGLRPEPLIGILFCGLYALLAPRVGFVLPTVLLIVVWVKFLHRESWLRAGLLGVGLTAVGIGLFSYVLQVPMPLLPSTR